MSYENTSKTVSEYLNPKGKNPKAYNPRTEAYSDYLSGFSWGYFCTFTFQKERTCNSAYQHVYNTISSNRLAGFMAIEQGELYGRVHAHALLSHVQYSASVESVQQRWNEVYGFCQVQKYNRPGGQSKSGKVDAAEHLVRRLYTVNGADKKLIATINKNIKATGGAVSYLCKYVLKSSDYYDFINLDKLYKA